MGWSTMSGQWKMARLQDPMGLDASQKAIVLELGLQLDQLDGPGSQLVMDWQFLEMGGLMGLIGLIDWSQMDWPKLVMAN